MCPLTFAIRLTFSPVHHVYASSSVSRRVERALLVLTLPLRPACRCIDLGTLYPRCHIAVSPFPIVVDDVLSWSLVSPSSTALRIVLNHREPSRLHLDPPHPHLSTTSLLPPPLLPHPPSVITAATSSPPPPNLGHITAQSTSQVSTCG